MSIEKPSKEELAKIAKAEEEQGVVDQQTIASAKVQKEDGTAAEDSKPGADEG